MAVAEAEKVEDAQAGEPQEAATEVTRQETEYVILVRVDAKDAQAGGISDTWKRERDTITASNKDAAIKKFTDALGEGNRAGAYKAVSASGWKGGKQIAEKQVVAVESTEIED
jgi:hypothetical protein